MLAKYIDCKVDKPYVKLSKLSTFYNTQLLVSVVR